MKLPIVSQACFLAAACHKSRPELRCILRRKIESLEKMYCTKIKSIADLPVQKQAGAYKRLLKAYSTRLKKMTNRANQPRVSMSAKQCAETVTFEFVKDIMVKVMYIKTHDTLTSNTLLKRHLDYVLPTLMPFQNTAIEELEHALERPR